ncbi:MAG: Hsp20/alpha crystallin family protein [Candidatus Omnitrophica bacterium]|nr:Hsp20/alpha crystallin family protein [Candidatus Omnitrophota bacterium]
MANYCENNRVVTPAVNILETEKDVMIEAEMAGLSKEDISLDIEGDELMVKGARKAPAVPNGYTAVYTERCPFEYSRTFILGDEVKRENITAKYESGILKVVIPKSEKAQPRKIQVTD